MSLYKVNSALVNKYSGHVLTCNDTHRILNGSQRTDHSMWIAFCSRCRIYVLWVGELVIMVTRERVRYHGDHVRFGNVTWYLNTHHKASTYAKVTVRYNILSHL